VALDADCVMFAYLRLQCLEAMVSVA